MSYDLKLLLKLLTHSMEYYFMFFSVLFMGDSGILEYGIYFFVSIQLSNQ